MTFLFDLGRVLIDFDFETSLARLVPEDCLDLQARFEAMFERKDEFEQGRISNADFINFALKALQSEASPEQFIHAWRHIFTANEPMWDVVTQLKHDGHRLILFSNNNAIHWPWTFEQFPKLQMFDHLILSHEVGFVKPEPEIYQYAIERYRLDPAQTIYIDDLPQNIAGGNEHGFRSFCYDLKQHGAFETWLKSEMQQLTSQ